MLRAIKGQVTDAPNWSMIHIGLPRFRACVYTQGEYSKHIAYYDTYK